jgi:hypothetical protein
MVEKQGMPLSKGGTFRNLEMAKYVIMGMKSMPIWE